jgi:hypothetical protein
LDNFGPIVTAKPTGLSMTKAYLTKWTSAKKPGEEHKADFLFDHDPEKAASWATKDAADDDCHILNTMSVEITSPDGAKHLCRRFEVEERNSDKFVVFCMLPWSPRL